MKGGQSYHKLLSHVLLSTFGCYEYTENMQNNSLKQNKLLFRYEN